MRYIAYSSRKFSGAQEKCVAKRLGGKTVANSGAALFVSGDVKTNSFVIECKTAMSKKQSFSIKEEWVQKAKEECFSQGKPYWAICYNYGSNTPNSNLQNYYVINEVLFKKLLRYIDND